MIGLYIQAKNILKKSDWLVHSGGKYSAKKQIGLCIRAENILQKTDWLVHSGGKYSAPTEINDK